MELPSFLADSEPGLILFSGKGGTGKTTCAAATALYLSGISPARKNLLVSTDPAHSIRDSLCDLQVPENLEVLEFDAARAFERFRDQHGGTLLEIADRGTLLDKEDITRFLNLSMPGLDELFGFLEISRWVQAGRFDRIIVDTAPTGHTLRLLAMPRFFEEWVRALDSLLDKHRYMKEVFSGAYEPDDLDDFTLGLENSARTLERMLQSPSRSRFIPVMTAEELAISETARFLGALDELGIAAQEIVVNRIFAPGVCPACFSAREKQLDLLKKLPPEFSGRTEWLVPLFPEEIRGNRLRDFWTEAAPFDPGRQVEHRKTGTVLQGWRPLVENPAPLPSPGLKLILFGGKGGVGKTTMACATAIRLAGSRAGKNVLLFSADPAHSVSDCLEREIGPEPSNILPGLFAMEMNPEAEFAALKQNYKSEVEEFFDSFLHSIDLAFDREVMENIMDLSPPGLDEIMALTDIMDYLEEGRFGTLVVDAAPTGHLLRFLELPELTDQWIKAFFELFLKYKEVFRLPRMSGWLVSFSKRLKKLRAVLRNGLQSCVFAVAVPTEMAREETADLLAACRRLDIAVPTLFVNMVTHPDGCALCLRLYTNEAAVIDRMTKEFSGQHMTIVFRQLELKGINLLKELGNNLFSSS